ncbi:hypothetical protein ACQR35_12885 [Pseudarthrobacter sp. J1738]|uniref:hypothetical protein n=1 Tax=Pseudarthrobacter sp. J1738 TaxID=3420446 RepID=UPI003D2DB4C0
MTCASAQDKTFPKVPDEEISLWGGAGSRSGVEASLFVLRIESCFTVGFDALSVYRGCQHAQTLMLFDGGYADYFVALASNVVPFKIAVDAAVPEMLQTSTGSLAVAVVRGWLLAGDASHEIEAKTKKAASALDGGKLHVGLLPNGWTWPFAQSTYLKFLLILVTVRTRAANLYCCVVLGQKETPA